MPPSPAPTTSDGSTLGFTSQVHGYPRADSQFTGFDVVYSEPVIQPYTLVLPPSIGALQGTAHFSAPDYFTGFDMVATFPAYYNTFANIGERKSARIWPPIYIDVRT